MRRLVLVLALAGCGYHLVGSVQGLPKALPAGTKAVALRGEGALAKEFQARLQAAGVQVRDDATVVVRISKPRQALFVLAYDAAGRPRQYRLRLAAHVDVEAQGKRIWTSGEVSLEETLFLHGDPAALEAAAASRAKEMTPALAARLWRRFASGW